MRTISILFIFFVLIGCKEEKTFADDIVLSFPKEDKLTFQQFNEGIGESGTGVIYIGKEIKKIDVKYYKFILVHVKNFCT